MTGLKLEEKRADKAGKTKIDNKNQFTIWHQRLGHSSVSKMQHISHIKPCMSQKEEHVCITRPLAKMIKLSFPISNSHASNAFELIHTDIWGPYKVSTRGKFRYFLKIVDDFSRMT